MCVCAVHGSSDAYPACNSKRSSTAPSADTTQRVYYSPGITNIHDTAHIAYIGRATNSACLAYVCAAHHTSNAFPACNSKRSSTAPSADTTQRVYYSPSITNIHDTAHIARIGHRDDVSRTVDGRRMKPVVTVLNSASIRCVRYGAAACDAQCATYIYDACAVADVVAVPGAHSVRRIPNSNSAAGACWFTAADDAVNRHNATDTQPSGHISHAADGSYRSCAGHVADA